MHPGLLKEIVALCQRRQAQGDHPTQPIADAEVLENAIVQLAAERERIDALLREHQGISLETLEYLGAMRQAPNV